MCMGFPGSSAGKESACSAEDPSSVPGSGRSLGQGIGYLLQYSWASLVAQTVKNPESICNAGDLGLSPGLGRSPGGGHGNPFQYFFLENPRTEEPGGICSIESQSWTQLEQLSMRVCITLVSWMVYQILCSKGCLFQKNPTCDLCFKKEKIIIPIILVLTIFKWLGDDTT